MDQSHAVSYLTLPKVPPPLPANPPRSLPPGSRRSSSTSTSVSLTSPTQEKHPSQLPDTSAKPASPTRVAPPRPVAPSDLRRVPSSDGSAVTGPQTAFTVRLRSSVVRRPSGSLLGIGRRDAMLHSTEVRSEDGLTVYRRNASGVYFQVEQAWTTDDGSTGLEVGDEVLAVDNYKMVDMSLDTAR